MTITAEIDGEPVTITISPDDLDTEWVLHSGGEIIVSVPDLGRRYAVTRDSVRRID